MKVLHLPQNIASQASTTIRALQELGIEAKGLTIGASPIQDSNFIENFAIKNGKEYFYYNLLQKIKFLITMLKEINTTDVIHWHFSELNVPFNLDLKYMGLLKNKAKVVEFWGSDLRIPEVASSDNPYIKKMFTEYPKHKINAKERSLKTQRLFSKAGFTYVNGDYEMDPYIQKEHFPKYHRLKARVILSDFTPQFPDPEKKRPLIVHAPSRKEFKGTNLILKTIEELKLFYPFDFKLIENLPRPQALDFLAKSDIVIDELVSGTYGLLSCEAMALGKPVLCYIKPSVATHYPDLPIVNTSQENLKNILPKIILDSQLRNQIGQKSRAYVEKYHDAHKIAAELITVYKNLLKT